MSAVRNDADVFKNVLDDLSKKKQAADEKLLYGRELYRLIGLTSTSVATILKHKKKDYVNKFVENILDDEFCIIISENKTFGNGLMRALLTHGINEYWGKFFNIYDFAELDEEYVNEIFEYSLKNTSVLKTSADHSMMNNFLNYIMNKDFHKITELNDEEISLKKFTVNSLAVSEENA